MIVYILLFLFINSPSFAEEPVQISFLEITFVESDEITEADVLSRLLENGIEEYYGASNSFVYLNNFNTIEKIPLAEYQNRLLPFDPRNDGYAEKLLDFFSGEDSVHHIYIPYAGNITSMKNTEKIIRASLEDIPYTLHGITGKKEIESPAQRFFQIEPLAYFYKFLFIIAAIITIYISKNKYALLMIIPIIPLFFMGIYGALLAAILFTIYSSWQNVLHKLFSSVFLEKNFSRSARDDINLYQNITKTLITIFVYVYFCTTLNIDTAISLFTLFLFIGTLVISELIQILIHQRNGHILFLPLAINNSDASKFSFPVLCIPFSLCVIVSYIFNIITVINQNGNAL